MNEPAKNITIVKATVNDVVQLQAISKETFIETFSHYNTAENMKKYLEEGFSIERLTYEFKSNAEFYFAKSGEAIAGYLKVNFGASQTELKAENSMEIERIYVLQSYHGKKVGQCLYEKALEIAASAGVDFIWLGVWENNPRAIRFYEKNGFVSFDKHIFQLGDDQQIDILMKRRLK